MSFKKCCILVVLLFASTSLFAQSYYPWDVNVVYNSNDVVSHNGDLWMAKWWTKGNEPGISNVWVNQGIAPPPPTPVTPPEVIPGELYCAYNTLYESATSFKGKLTIKNPNSSYVWNGSFFMIWSLDFETTASITKVSNPGGGVSFTQAGNIVTLDLGWQSLFPYNKALEVTIEGVPSLGEYYPKNFAPDYIGGNDIIYPVLQDLPASWLKGKAPLTSSDLIINQVEYYKTNVAAVTDTAMLYNPPTKSQVQMGLPLSVGYPVNGSEQMRVWIPNKWMAMGLAFAQEEFGINPNWLVAIGCKENFACGITQENKFNGPILSIDGEDWIWPIVIAHSDGPFQVEAGNFRDLSRFFRDYFPENASHGDYMTVSADMNNPNWISSAITAAASLTITREQLNAVESANYNDFMSQAVDPWAEMVVLTFAYNRGMGALCERQLFSANRTKALSSTSIFNDFDMGGFASHIPSTLAVLDSMNKEVNSIYDAKLSWSDIQFFLNEMRTFFANGVPSDAEWIAMTADIQQAYNTLAAHWGGTHISFRYDFLTILRIMKKYRPLPHRPRLVTEDYYHRVKGTRP
jgi:hypothetical protein